jgi:hypothetical protein
MDASIVSNLLPPSTTGNTVRNRMPVGLRGGGGELGNLKT